MDTELTEEQKQALQDDLERGNAFEEMIRTKGWQFILAYYQNQLKSFLNETMQDKPSEEFENKRHELIGIKKLLSQVDSAIKLLEQEREKQKDAVAKSA